MPPPFGTQLAVATILSAAIVGRKESSGGSWAGGQCPGLEMITHHFLLYFTSQKSHLAPPNYKEARLYILSLHKQNHMTTPNGYHEEHYKGRDSVYHITTNSEESPVIIIKPLNAEGNHVKAWSGKYHTKWSQYNKPRIWLFQTWLI